MKTYRKDEIVNKHGQYIAYWSKQPGNTELEKYRRIDQDTTEYNQFVDKNGMTLTCFVSNQPASDDGHILLCFNHLGETILNTDSCYDNHEECVDELLSHYNII